MRFDRFIQRCRTEWPEFGAPARLEKSSHPATRDLSGVLEHVPGMATENKLKLLNLAAAALEDGEVYVEVGCYKGASLVGAAIGNPDARIFACDNFSQFDGAADALAAVLAQFTAPGQVEFHDLDFHEFMRRAPWRPAKIGAYFYDGGHSFEDQYEGMRLVLPHLANDALIVIDDTNKRAARSADALVARQTPGLELLLNLRTPKNHHPTWWNGIQLWRYRARAPQLAAAPPGIAFAARKLIYDDLFLNLKHRRRALRARIKQALKRSPKPARERHGQ
ncbi:MAG TPA: class I SAM-dependent methyltransferase [Candidatus Binataceae bacterium]|nr:class I SAM-dependent methyltransferase [Candidatus Binataceae bacterium]